MVTFNEALNRDNIPNEISDYNCDGAISYYEVNKSTETRVKLTEYFYRHRYSLGPYLRLLVSHKNGEYVLSMPPKPGDQVGFKQKKYSVDGEMLYSSYLDEKYGSHGVAWSSGNFSYLLIVKPTTWTLIEWVEKLVGTIVPTLKTSSTIVDTGRRKM